MPLSWKKRNRFSQLVADHLQSPKHGGSLVVETGFPTSLIDLYVRNRGRFRKSAVTKPTENESPTPSPSSSSGLLIDSVNLSSSSSLGSLLDSNNSSSGYHDHEENNEIIEDSNSSEIDVDSSVKLAKLNCASGNDIIEMDVSNSSEIEVERSVELAKLNPVFVVLLKVLIVIVLVIGTKRFVFGITVSAFLLFLLESIRKPLLRSSSSVDSKTPIESSFRENKAIHVVSSQVMEIEELESENKVTLNKKSAEVRSEESMEAKSKNSRRAIMKSRMKKLVPKKLRRSSMASKGKTSSELCVRDVKLKPLVLSSHCSDSKADNLSVLKRDYDEIVEIEKRSSSLTYSSEIYCKGNELRIDSRQNCGYLVLCLIVLVGLIGGRVLALSLAVSWCLMLKMLQWRNVKFFFS